MAPKDLHTRLEDWEFGKGIRESASETEIQKLEDVWKIKLPHDFKRFLLQTNGFDGACGDWGFVIYDIDEIISFYNHHTKTCNGSLPTNVVQFGGDGAGEIFLFDFRKNQFFWGFTSGIMGMDEFIKLGTTFNEFIENYYWTSMKGFEFGKAINEKLDLL